MRDGCWLWRKWGGDVVAGANGNKGGSGLDVTRRKRRGKESVVEKKR